MQIDPLKLPARISVLTVKVLVALYEGDRPNNTTLAKRCKVSSAAITQRLAELRRLNLAAEVPHPSNRLECQHILTRKGVKVVRSWQRDTPRQIHHPVPILPA